jgi:hypothetical protein
MEDEYGQAEAGAISVEDVGPPPRRVELTAKGWGWAIATTIIVTIALIYAGFVGTEAARQIHVRNALRNAGNQATAQITAVPNPLHMLKFYVDYTFIEDGQTYTGEAIAPLLDVHGVLPGNSLAIRYLPQNPTVNHPADWEWSAISEFDGIMAFVLIAVCGISFVPSQLRFERRLASHGIATMGVVTKCSVRGRGGVFITLKYKFRAQEGTEMQGRGDFETRQELGTKILILYSPRKPRQSAPYPFSNWRITKS